MTPEQIERIEKLIEAGEKATQGEWETTREMIDIDYYDAVRVKGAHPDHALFCYPENQSCFPMPNYSDSDARFVTHAANTRSDIKALLDGYREMRKLAYHKEGVSYRTLFTASLGMYDKQTLGGNDE